MTFFFSTLLLHISSFHLRHSLHFVKSLNTLHVNDSNALGLSAFHARQRWQVLNLYAIVLDLQLTVFDLSF